MRTRDTRIVPTPGIVVKWVTPGPAFLFCPADRPERFEKAARLADVVLIDLEDGVASERRNGARDAVRAAGLDPVVTVIRINPAGTDEHHRDLDTIMTTDFRKIMLAMTTTAKQIRALAPLDVIALCETPMGVSDTDAVMWGAEDLVAALGGNSSGHANGAHRDLSRYATAKVLVDAGSNEVGALDAVFLNFGDLEGQRTEAADAAEMGFMATPCIRRSLPGRGRARGIPTRGRSGSIRARSARWREGTGRSLSTRGPDGRRSGYCAGPTGAQTRGNGGGFVMTIPDSSRRSAWSASMRKFDGMLAVTAGGCE